MMILLMNQGFFWFPIIFSLSLIRRVKDIFFFGLICERLSQHLDASPMDCRRCPTDLAGVQPGPQVVVSDGMGAISPVGPLGVPVGPKGPKGPKGPEGLVRYLYLPFQINPKHQATLGI